MSTNIHSPVNGGQLRVPYVRNKGRHSTSQHYNFGVRCLRGDVKLHLIQKIDEALKPSSLSKLPLKRKNFPPDFLFGASTSALQTEGAGDEGGRGPSTWDSFIQFGDEGKRHIATDSYHRYPDDVQCLVDIGLNAYRMSISWSRILPKGRGQINQQGIDFYNKFIDALVDKGITPFVTLFHFDLPQALQDEYQGFVDRKIVDDFTNFADICFKNFGDCVKYWLTVNEPQIWGTYGNGSQTASETLLCNHHIILAHASSAKVYNEKYKATQCGEIGISLAAKWFEPHALQDPIDIDAVDRALDFSIGWYMHPLVTGEYPFQMTALLGNILPAFSPDEKEMVKGAYDFIGINYYTSRYAKGIPFNANNAGTLDGYQHVEAKVDRNGIPIGPQFVGGSEIYVYPAGLREILIYLKNRYDNPKFFVTENGISNGIPESGSYDEAKDDDFRIEHIKEHLKAVREARWKGANVKGFFIWALMDNMEMNEGYKIRFGLNFTDYAGNLDRKPKASAEWLGAFMRGE